MEKPIKRRKLVRGSSEDSQAMLPSLSESNRHKSRHLALGSGPIAKSSKIRISEAHQHLTQLASKDELNLQVEKTLGRFEKRYIRLMDLAGPHLQRLKSAIDAIPNRPPVWPKEGQRTLWTEAQVATPFPKPDILTGADFKVSYARPYKIHWADSFTPRLAAFRPCDLPIIDMVLTLPAGIFQEEDHLNYRYFQKRAYFIACVVGGLALDPKHGFTLQYTYLNGNLLQPSILATKQAKSSEQSFCVQIITASPATASPSNEAWYSESYIRDPLSSQPNSGLTPSAFIHNSTYRAECVVHSYSCLFRRLESKVQSFRKACYLVAMWLRCRQFGTTFEGGGFGDFEGAVSMALLLETDSHKGQHIFSHGYNPFQLFKGLIHFLANQDFIKSPAILGGRADRNISTSTLNMPLLWDCQRKINVLYKMSIGSYRRLQHHACRTREIFERLPVHLLGSLFLTDMDYLPHQYDDTFSVKVQFLGDEEPAQYEGLSNPVIASRKLFDIFDFALSSRVSVIHFDLRPPRPWNVKKVKASEIDGITTLFISLRSEHVHRTVDRGPSAQDKKAATRFQHFWGPKAELRRFQDGQLLESVLWNGDSSGQSIHRQIIRSVCERHLNNEPFFLSTDLYAIGEVPNYNHRVLERSNRLWQSFHEVAAAIRSLEGLPLYIRQISPTSISFSNTDSRHQRGDQMGIAIEFESSTKWPEELIAVQRTKLALLSKMCDLLKRDDLNFRWQICLEDQSFLRGGAYLELSLPKSNISYHIRIHYERERELLTRLLQNVRTSSERERAVDSLTLWDRTFTRGPQHTHGIRRLSLQLSLLLPSIALFHKWCSAHLLLSHLSDDFIELLTVHAFTQPAPFDAPVNVGSALIRTLKFIVEWDWRYEPLVVDFGGISVDQMVEVMTRFNELRRVDAHFNHITVFAASSGDMGGMTWTGQGPTRAVMARLKALAKVSVAKISRDCLQDSMRLIFATGLLDFDFVIYLRHGLGDAALGKDSHIASESLLVPPARIRSEFPMIKAVQSLIKEIQQAHSRTIVFFHNLAETPIIGAMWAPIRGTKRCKANMNFSAAPTGIFNEEGPAEGGVGDRLTTNKTAVLSDIARLGGDMILKIDVISTLH